MPNFTSQEAATPTNVTHTITAAAVSSPSIQFVIVEDGLSTPSAVTLASSSITSGSKLVTVSSTANLRKRDVVSSSSAGIPGSTTINEIVSTTTYSLNNAATATNATISLVHTPPAPSGYLAEFNLSLSTNATASGVNDAFTFTLTGTSYDGTDAVPEDATTDGDEIGTLTWTQNMTDWYDNLRQ